jgi:RimJ/RimL family protein N-acetyltransferase
MATTQAVSLLRGADNDVARWVANQIGGAIQERGFEQCAAIGVVLGNNAIAGVVYNHYYPEYGVIEISAAATDRRWLNRRTIYELLAFPFETLKVQLVVMRVSALNTRMLGIAVRLGFLGYPIPRLRGRTEDEVIFTLSDDGWRSGRFGRAPDEQRRQRTDAD